MAFRVVDTYDENLCEVPCDEADFMVKRRGRNQFLSAGASRTHAGGNDEITKPTAK
jgi:hypothetical protein